MTQRTTDVAIFDELAQEAGELSHDPESGRVIDPDLIASAIAKLTTLMRQPPEAYSKPPARCHLTEIDHAVRSELFADVDWNPNVRRECFSKQIATIQSMGGEGSRDRDALIELDRFLRMVIVGLETYRAHSLRR